MLFSRPPLPQPKTSHPNPHAPLPLPIWDADGVRLQLHPPHPLPSPYLGVCPQLQMRFHKNSARVEVASDAAVCCVMSNISIHICSLHTSPSLENILGPDYLLVDYPPHPSCSQIESLLALFDHSSGHCECQRAHTLDCGPLGQWHSVR